MRYVLLICNDENAQQALSPEEGRGDDGRVRRLRRRDGRPRRPAGTASGCGPPPTATTVRVSDGEVLTADGPFAETKEQMGGYYVVDCKDLDEAIEVAAKIPAARTGTIEIRPIWEM